MKNRQQAGMSLVELMIALVLGLVVVGTVIEIFISTRQIYSVQDSKARLQENGRYAMQFLSQHILNASYHGCASKANPEINNKISSNAQNENDDFRWKFETPIFGYNDTSPNATNTKINGWLRGDVLILRGINGSPVDIEDAVGDKLKVKTGHGFDPGENDIVMISNCLNSTVAQFNDVGETDITFKDMTATDLTPYTTGYVTPVSTKSFFIREKDGIASLYWLNSDHFDDSKNQAVEAIDGIENMQILYGLDADNDMKADKYVNASQIATDDWANVLSIQIQLLLKSRDSNIRLNSDDPTQSNSYYFDLNGDGVEEEIKSGDNHFYKVITQTIALRNRVN